jgi:hypothetical protein
MCHGVRCRQCGKPTWAGCGAHVEHALAGVPREARCQCREGEPAAVLGAKPAQPAKRKRFGLF